MLEEAMRRVVDFDKLQTETNADIYAWIYIPDTNIDYPVLQHPTDDTRYLNYNIDGSKGYPGCIYTEKANAKDFSDFNTCSMICISSVMKAFWKSTLMYMYTFRTKS